MAIRTRRLRNGKTAYDVELRRPDGTKYSKTFCAKRDAQAWEAEQRTDRARNRWVDPTAGRVELSKYAAEWMRTRQLAPRTREDLHKPAQAHPRCVRRGAPERDHTARRADVARRALRPRELAAGGEVLSAPHDDAQHRRRGRPHRQEPLPAARGCG